MHKNAIITSLILAIFIIFITTFGVLYYLEFEAGSLISGILLSSGDEPGNMQEQNITLIDEETALAKAQYKLMALGSFRKTYKNHSYLFAAYDEDGNPLSQEILNDFAGLSDYEGKDSLFYLSPYFLMTADEVFHKKEFRNPQQLIKPVNYKYDSGKVSLLQLTEHDEGNGSITLTAFSNLPGSDNATGIKKEGIWDYGLGSVLEYAPYEKDSWIECEYKGIEVHRHKHSWKLEDKTYSLTYESESKPVSEQAGKAAGDTWNTYKVLSSRKAVKTSLEEDGLNEDGSIKYKKTSKSYTVYKIEKTVHELVWKEIEECVKDPYLVNIEGLSSPENIKAAISKASEPVTPAGGKPWYTVEVQPNKDEIAVISSAEPIHLPISEIDKKYAKLHFYDEMLEPFSNNKALASSAANIVNLVDLNLANSLYPINIAMIDSAALFSGSISYDYDYSISSDPLPKKTGFCITNLATELEYAGSLPCSLGNSIALKISRTGTIKTKIPFSSQVSMPCSFDYLEDYAQFYSCYIPEDLLISGFDFKSRLEECPSAFGLLKSMGLLEEYEGGFLNKVFDPSEYEIASIAAEIEKLPGSYSYFEKQLAAAVLINQIKAGQRNLEEKAINSSNISAENIKIAKQVLSGSFAIPSNITSYSSNEGEVYIRTSNLMLSARDHEISSTDWAGRTALSASELKTLSEKESIALASGDALYIDSPLDISRAYSMMQNQEDKPFWEDFAGSELEALKALYEFFDISENSSDRLVKYQNSSAVTNIDTAVYKALSLGSGCHYDEVYDNAKNINDLKILFAGQDHSFRFSASSSIGIADLLDDDGDIDLKKLNNFKEYLKSTNNRAKGIYDEWHRPPKNNGIIGQCPWWAYGRALEYIESTGLTVKLPGQTDGGRMLMLYRNSFETGLIPRANSLVVWSGGGMRHMSLYGRECGHVAYVEAVLPDGSYYISESGGSLNSPACTHITDNYYGSSYKLEGFVYLDEPLIN